jgi:hypothetical protein
MFTSNIVDAGEQFLFNRTPVDQSSNERHISALTSEYFYRVDETSPDSEKSFTVLEDHSFRSQASAREQ